MKLVPKHPLDNKSALGQLNNLVIGSRTGDKALSEPMSIQFTEAYMRN